MQPITDFGARLPDSGGLRARGARDALESMVLALSALGVAPSTLRSATETVLDAWDNNAEAAERVSVDEVLVVSTAHLREDDREALDSGRLPDGLMVSMECEYGGLVHVDRDTLLDPSNGSGLVAAARMAADLGCAYVRFDGAGPVVEGLPVFEWT